MEKEKEQLKIKLENFENKQKSEDFKKLLKATSELRKQQEEETDLQNKLYEQKEYLEQCEEIKLYWQQKLYDAQNSYGQQTSA